MFKHLVASQTQRGGVWSSKTVGVSVVTHLVLLAAIVYASVGGPQVQAATVEEVTFIELKDLEEEQDPAAEETEPAEQAESAPRPTLPPPPSMRIGESLAQADLAAVDVSAVESAAVESLDFSGLGRAPVPRSRNAAAAPGRSATPGVYRMEEIGARPELTNTREMLRLLERVYPPQLANSGVVGRVQVLVMIDTDGSVVPGSAQIISSSHSFLDDGAIRIAEQAQFRPIQHQGRTVRVWAVLPISFQPPR
jgi:TonB family protein